MRIYYNRTKHINVLDDFRAIVMIIVIFYHFFFMYFRDKEIKDNSFLVFYSLLNDYLNFGVVSVSLFFLLIGFVLPISSKGENLLISIYSFTIKKNFKLYPRYWFLIILIEIIISVQLLSYLSFNNLSSQTIVFNMVFNLIEILTNHYWVYTC